MILGQSYSMATYAKLLLFAPSNQARELKLSDLVVISTSLGATPSEAMPFSGSGKTPVTRYVKIREPFIICI